MADTTASPKDYVSWRQLHPQSIKGTKEFDMDVAFFHGLQLGDGTNAGEKAWTDAHNHCWPRDSLPKLLAPLGVRVLEGSYNAQASRWRTGAYGVPAKGHKRTADCLFHFMVNFESCSLGRRPFVLVGHSYGGIVVRSLVVFCEEMSNRSSATLCRQIDSAKKFMENLKGCIFFGVPLEGSKLANCFSLINKCIRNCVGKTVSSDLVTSSKPIQKLNERFKAVIEARFVKQLAFGETKPTKCCITVVGRASAQSQLDDLEFVELPGTDHRTVNKFSDVSSPGLGKVREFIKDVITPNSIGHSLRSDGQNPHARKSEPTSIEALQLAPDEEENVLMTRFVERLRPSVEFADESVKKVFVEKSCDLIKSLYSKASENSRKAEIGREPRMIEQEHVLGALGEDHSRASGACIESTT